MTAPRTFSFIVLLTLVLVLSWPTCITAAPASGGTLFFARSADSTYLDPAMYLDNESAKVIENIFDGLVRFKDDSTEVEPALAKSWENSEDGLEWTFHLRSGVFFHDGTPLDAEACEFSFRRRYDTSHDWYRKDYSQMDSWLKSIEEVRALDPVTLRIRLKEPYAPLLNSLATHSSYIVSPAAVKEYGDDFYRHPVGSGPFIFDSWIPEDRIILRANADYWNRAPYLDQVVIATIPDTKRRLRELRIGSVHVMDGIKPQDRNELLKNPTFDLKAGPGLNIGYLAMNNERPPFDDLKVRLAVNHAINKKGLVKLLYQGMATPAKNPIPPGMWSYNDAVRDYEYNPELSKRLLAEAGYPDGFETTLWAMPVPRPYLPSPRKIALALQGNLAAVGIRTTIVSHDWRSYLAKLYNGEHDMALLGWIGTVDPDNFFYNLLSAEKAVKPHASNIALFRDDSVTRLINEARQTMDMTRRAGLYARVQEIFHRKAPWVPLAHGHQAMALKRGVHSVVFHATGVLRFHNAWIEP